MRRGLSTSLQRRNFIKTGVAALAGATLGAPAFLKAQERPIRVGILQPFSGGLEVLGEQGFQGAKLAIDEVNAAGGLLGRKIEFIRADTRTDPMTAVEQTVQLIKKDGVDVIIGPVTSAERDAVRPTVERAKVPLLYATDYEGGVCSRYVTCYSLLPTQSVSPMMAYASKSVGKKMYLVGSDYIWPKKTNADVRASAQQQGAQVVGEEYVPFGITDFTSILRKVKASGADTLVVTVVGADAITLIKQLVSMGMKPSIKVIFYGFSENYLAGLTHQESEDIITISSFTASLGKPETIAFVKKVHDRYGPQVIVSNTTNAHYNSMRLYFGGVQRAQSVDKEKVTDAMLGQTILTGNGQVFLRPDDRHMDLDVVISRAQGGRLELLQDVGRMTAPSQCVKS